MQRNATNRYPILLIHGLFGFDRIGSFELFHDVKQALRNAGARVFIPHLSATHSNEARGDQLMAQIERVLAGTGARKVNLIGHSQGALAARYAAAVEPQIVASVTSVCGPNHGSELADFLRKALEPGRLPEHVARAVATLFVDFLSLLSGNVRLPQNAIAALNALTTEGVGAFNDKYPQGLPENWGGQGPELVNGVRYYSWSGTLKQNIGAAVLDALDPVQFFCRAFSEYFITEAEQNDGMVGRYSSHLGNVIRSDYPMNHLDSIRQTPGVGTQGFDSIALYLQHAERLRRAGL
ncbi:MULTISPECIES: triacylglycerol lipase [unclassified Pseudomonas]|uniref:esterase/lipase family protein n=1 Tax=unclassified Pseudomonas TaxID=196821 RepID=UPI002AC9788E|nr:MULTISPECIES: triacylglycerol lipase [unclassified Pseudomonas]MEB0046667.1 triacylglycerol lipase [Pseudomonas sp. Dout3]MEB0098549.1 triacylglycerol lipase [Pseudomonas sp. DC1.2]WPX56676.1 triacylglycerol lipase [Pseudomonas sp. DC1.2]